MPTPEETKQLAAAAKLAEEGQEKLNAAIDSYNQKLEKANELKREGQTIEEAKLEKEQAIAQAQERQNELRREAAALARELNEHAATMSEEAKQDNKDKIQAKKELIGLLKEQNQQQTNQSNILNSVIEDQKRYGKEVEKNLRNAEAKTNEFGSLITRFASDIPIIGSSLAKALNQKKNIGTLGSQLAELGESSGNKMLSTLGKGMSKFAEGIKVGNVAVVAMAGFIGRLALQFDNLSKEIGRSTGFGNKFNKTLIQGYKATMFSGVSIQEYGQAITGLANNFSAFNPNAEKTNIALANTVSRLEKLGVGAAESAKLMDHFHRAMNVSKEMAADMTAQLVMMGREIGISTSKMAADFQASAGILARYGKNNIKVFKQLAAQAKATGLEMGTLLGMAEKFDQFDTAADSASKLNAVLGTQLSTLEMMNMNEAERIDMIKQQVQASVGNFDSLDKFTKLYVAQAMGVKDVAEAQRLMNMSMAERNALASKQKEQADIQAELAEATAKLVPMMDRLKIIGMKLLMVFEPLIGFFHGLFAVVDTVYNKIGELTGGMSMSVEIGEALKVVVLGIGLALGVIFGPVSAGVAIFTALASAIGAVWNIIHKPGSLSIADGLMDKTIGNSVSKFGADALGAQKDIANLSSEMEGMYDAAHKGGGNAIDVQAMASLDTTAIAAGFDKIKSAVMELSNIKIDGFLAMSTSGDSSSFVMGSDGLIKSISEGKLIVDVKMPEMKLPEVLVKVFIGNTELTTLIDQRIEFMGGGIG